MQKNRCPKIGQRHELAHGTDPGTETPIRSDPASTVVHLASTSTRGRPRRFRDDAPTSRVQSFQLLDVTAFWPWIVYPKPFVGRTRRDEVRDEENRISLAIVTH